MRQRSQTRLDRWKVASVSGAATLLLGHSAFGQTSSAFQRLTGPTMRAMLERVRPLDSAEAINVMFGVETLLEGSVEYNTTTCALISSGEYSATSEPSHGNLTYGTLDHALQTTDHCNGVVLPFAVVYYTWTDDQTDSTQDSFAVEWKTPDGTEGGPYSYVANLTNPQTAAGILYNGVNVAGMSSQKVVVGQEVTLQAYPSNGHWVTPIDGQPIAGFQPSDLSCIPGDTPQSCPPPADFSNSLASFYWYKPSGGGTYSATYSYPQNDGTIGTVTAKFSVVGPDNLLTYQPTPSNRSYLLNGDTPSRGISTPDYLGCGAKQPSVIFPGLPPDVCEFFFIVNADTEAAGGSFKFIQLLDHYNYYYITPKGRMAYVNTPGLDTAVPYPGYGSVGSIYYQEDFPRVGLLSSCAIGVDTLFQATTYVLWKPDLSNAIYVPLGSFSWHWNASAFRESLTSAWSTSSPGASVSDFVKGSSYPAWTNLVTPLPTMCGAP